MEARCDDGDGEADAQVGDHFMQSRGGIEEKRDGFFDGEAVGTGIVCLICKKLSCEGLQLHCALGLIGDLMADAEERCSGVKEAARAGGIGKIDAASELGGECVALGDGDGLDAGQVFVPGNACGPQVRESHAVWLADGAVPAGERDVLEMAEALEAAVGGGKDFAAPDGAVCAEACAVERDRHDFFFFPD
jgi:hypothetical protein